MRFSNLNIYWTLNILFCVSFMHKVAIAYGLNTLCAKLHDRLPIHWNDVELEIAGFVGIWFPYGIFLYNTKMRAVF